MKKIILTATAILAVMALTACGDNAVSSTAKSDTVQSASQSTEQTSENSVISLSGNVTATIDKKNSPFDGFSTVILRDKVNKTVKFIKADPNSDKTAQDYIQSKDESNEYYLFDINANTVVHYTFDENKSGIYYTYDLNNDKIVKIEDSEHKDITQSDTDNSSLSTTADALKTDIETLRTYSKNKFKKSVSELV